MLSLYDLEINASELAGHSAYEDTPWILKLVSFVQRVAAEKPKIKLIGTS